ncbi:MAG: YicC/YloC family endoribonuclease [Thermodesulfobacteriota bacterium]
MPINSMTGYGRAEFLIRGAGYGVEVRSLNHRHLEIRVKTPDSFFSLEDRIRKEVEKRFHRGVFNLFITCNEDEKIMGLKINKPLAKEYLASLRELQSNLGIDGEINLDLLLKLRGVITHKKEGIGDESWVAVEDGLNMALEDLAEMRRTEGEGLEEDIKNRLNGLQEYLADIEKRCSPAGDEHMNRLGKRLEGLIKEYKIDDARMLQEMALLVERSDVTEEITRLKVHIDHFKEVLKGSGPVGKKMDFICQEMGREANTIGSKSIDHLISSLVVELKSDIDRIKAQVQNIE